MDKRIVLDYNKWRNVVDESPIDDIVRATDELAVSDRKQLLLDMIKLWTCADEVRIDPACVGFVIETAATGETDD